MINEEDLDSFFKCTISEYEQLTLILINKRNRKK